MTLPELRDSHSSIDLRAHQGGKEFLGLLEDVPNQRVIDVIDVIAAPSSRSCLRMLSTVTRFSRLPAGRKMSPSSKNTLDGRTEQGILQIDVARVNDGGGVDFEVGVCGLTPGASVSVAAAVVVVVMLLLGMDEVVGVLVQRLLSRYLCGILVLISLTLVLRPYLSGKIHPSLVRDFAVALESS